MEKKDPLTLDRDFLRALVSREFNSLEQILADDFILIDLSGMVVAKEEFLGSLRLGDLKFETIHAEEISLRVYGPAALVRGLTTMKGSFKSAPFAFNSRYTHTYVEQEGRWRMVAAQGTPVGG